MQSFQIIKPCTALAPYIRHYWILQDDAVFPVAERVLPVGCMQMVFHKGRQLLSLSGHYSRNLLFPVSRSDFPMCSQRERLR